MEAWTKRITSSNPSDLHFTSLAENKHNIMKDPSSTSSTAENKQHTSSVMHFSTKALVYAVHCSPRNISWCFTWNLLFTQQLPYPLQQKEISCAEEFWLHGKEEEQEESYVYNWHFSCFIQFSWIIMSDFDSCNPFYIINNCVCAHIKWASMTIFASNQKIAKYCLKREKKNILPLPLYFHTWILEYISLTSNYPSSSFSDSMTILIWNCLFSDTCWQPDLFP